MAERGGWFRRLVAGASFRVFVAFLAIYVATAPGGYECTDAEVRFATAKSWVEGQGGAVSAAYDYPPAPDGRHYAFYGPLQSVLMLPTLLLAKAIAHGSPDTLARLGFGIAVIPLISALSMALLFEALTALGYSRRISLLTTVVVGIATPMWHYARSGQEENIIGAAFGAYLLGMAWLLRKRYAGLVLVAAAAGVVVSTRLSYGPVLAVLVIPVAQTLWADRAEARRWGPSFAAACAVGAVPVLAVLWYDNLRFGNPLETGYSLAFRAMHTPFFVWGRELPVIAALLVSPYRGLLWFCPAIVVLLGVVGVVRPEPVRRLEVTLWAACAVNLVFISSFFVWTAGFAWGPRYLVASLVLLAPLFAAVLASGRKWVLPVLVASVVVQVCSVVLPSAAENFVMSERAEASPDACTPWTCDCTALCLRPPWAARAIANTVLARPLPVLDTDSPSDKQDIARILASSDYESVYWWPVRAAYRLHLLNPALAFAGCLAVLGLAAYALWALYRGLPEREPA